MTNRSSKITEPFRVPELSGAPFMPSNRFRCRDQKGENSLDTTARSENVHVAWNQQKFPFDRICLFLTCHSMVTGADMLLLNAGILRSCSWADWSHCDPMQISRSNPLYREIQHETQLLFLTKSALTGDSQIWVDFGTSDLSKQTHSDYFEPWSQCYGVWIVQISTDLQNLGWMNFPCGSPDWMTWLCEKSRSD